MEENAKIFCMEFWNKPPVAPTVKEIITLVISNQIELALIWVITIRESGIIFWIEDRIKILYHDTPVKTGLTHWWKGAAPNLIKILAIKRLAASVNDIGIVIITIIIKEEILWTRKYFIALSEEFFVLVINNGKNESKLISSINQINSKESKQELK